MEKPRKIIIHPAPGDAKRQAVYSADLPYVVACTPSFADESTTLPVGM